MEIIARMSVVFNTGNFGHLSYVIIKSTWLKFKNHNFQSFHFTYFQLVFIRPYDFENSSGNSFNETDEMKNKKEKTVK